MPDDEIRVMSPAEMGDPAFIEALLTRIAYEPSVDDRNASLWSLCWRLIRNERLLAAQRACWLIVGWPGEVMELSCAIADLYADAGDTDEARAMVRFAIDHLGAAPELETERVPALSSIARSLKRLGDLERALDYLGRASAIALDLQHSPDPQTSVDASKELTAIARELVELGEADSAREMCAKIRHRSLLPLDLQALGEPAPL
jgi:tetratricopeptide (TPR) repeat protein